ncbi:hypothetical protein BBJ28_00019586 [Nothophytophthora sp. Chile5]|nr:hypothetical protein BBJ28_00019586 [Nothophytophthora sp. Chile5]
MAANLGGVPLIRFGAARRAQLEELCDDLIERALDAHDQFHASASLSAWHLVRHRDAMSVYRPRTPPRALRHDAAGEDRARLLLGSGIVPGTLDDALNGVYCDSTESLRITKSILSDKFVDGAVLRVFESNGLQAPIVFAGIKWFVMRGAAGSGGLMNDRDMITYERMGRIVDRQGEYFAYHVLQSVDLSERPANREKRVLRCRMSWCYLYRQLSPDWVGVFMLGDLDLASSMPHSITSFVAAERVLSAGNFLRCAQAKRFSALMAASAGSVPDGGAPHCVVCLSPPPKLLGCAHKLCMGCRQRVCRKCRQRRVIFHLQLRSGKPETEHFCRLCVARVTGRGGVVDSSGMGFDEVQQVLRAGSRTAPTSSHSSAAAESAGLAQSKLQRSASASEDAEAMRLAKLAAFARQCHDSDAPDHRRITWNREELLQISRFLGDSSLRERRRERRQRARSGHRSASQPPTRPPQKQWDVEDSSSSATSSGRHESSTDYNESEELYTFSHSPAAELLGEDARPFEDEAGVESGPWSEKVPNVRSGQTFVVFDEDRQEYVRLRVPETQPEPEDAVHERRQTVCIDELD